MPRALNIGSGVAGPATAMFLARAGWDVEIFEANPRPEPYEGLFLNVATNGLAVLEQLGLRDRLDGHRSPRMVMWSSTGAQLGVVPNGPAREPERGSLVVRRGLLHAVLGQGAAESGIPISYDSRLVSIEETEDAVRATFADGRVATGDILIGCDGVRSVARAWIDPHAPSPRYSGLIGLGGFCRVEGLAPTPDTQHMVFGRRSFFGYLVRDDGTVYWFANVTAPEGDRDDDWISRLRELHADDPYPVPQILAAQQEPVGAYPIHDLVGVRHWSRGRVVAVGDAVHATSPSAGQGSSLALEDAVTLARCLRDLDGHEAAFAEYQRLRQPRAERIVRYARAINAQKRVTKSRVGIAIRDAMMPRFLAKASDDTRNDWLYNHRVDWERVDNPR